MTARVGSQRAQKGVMDMMAMATTTFGVLSHQRESHLRQRSSIGGGSD